MALALLLAAPASSALAQAQPQLRIDAAREALWLDPAGFLRVGATGNDIGVLITAQVNPGHPDLEDCASSDRSRTTGLPGRLLGQGTYVASLVCGNGALSDGELLGVAPDAWIWSTSLSTSSGDENALDGWFREGTGGIRVVVSTSGNPLPGLVNMGMPPDHDVLLVVPVGDGGGSGTEANTPSFLASDPRFLGVAATNATGEGAASYSGRGHADRPETWPHAAAPGCVYGAWEDQESLPASTQRPGGANCPPGSDEEHAERLASGYKLMATTLASAALVGGVATLLFEVNPRLTAPQASQILAGTATPLADQPSFAVGGGRVDAVAAMAAAHYLRLHEDATVQEALECSVVYEPANLTPALNWINPCTDVPASSAVPDTDGGFMANDVPTSQPAPTLVEDDPAAEADDEPGRPASQPEQDDDTENQARPAAATPVSGWIIFTAVLAGVAIARRRSQ